MYVLEKNREEVRNRANTMSDFLRMEYLGSCTETIRDLSVLEYCYAELARLYENKVMYTEALKYLAKLSSLTTTNTSKLKIFEKQIEILIKSGNYDRVLDYYKEAAKIATTINAYDLKRKIVEMFYAEASKLEDGKKYYALSKLYERLILFLTDYEKTEAKKKLLVCYDKLGKVRESIELEKNIQR